MEDEAKVDTAETPQTKNVIEPKQILYVYVERTDGNGEFKVESGIFEDEQSLADYLKNYSPNYEYMSVLKVYANSLFTDLHRRDRR